MKNQLFDEIPKSVKLSTGRWVHILPNTGEGYRVYDPIAELDLGRILFDAQEHWIYDSEILSIAEQEEIAGAITGHQQEMAALLRTLQEDEDKNNNN
jgi:hypothetical protein